MHWGLHSFFSGVKSTDNFVILLSLATPECSYLHVRHRKGCRNVRCSRWTDFQSSFDKKTWIWLLFKSKTSWKCAWWKVQTTNVKEICKRLNWHLTSVCQPLWRGCLYQSPAQTASPKHPAIYMQQNKANTLTWQSISRLWRTSESAISSAWEMRSLCVILGSCSAAHLVSSLGNRFTDAAGRCAIEKKQRSVMWA